jgi:hypothetical protein
VLKITQQFLTRGLVGKRVNNKLGRFEKHGILNPVSGVYTGVNVVHAVTVASDCDLNKNLKIY